MYRSCFTFLLSGVLIASPLAQAEVRRIVHPDGRVEYTNIAPQQKAGVVSTYYKYRKDNGVLSFTDEKPSGVEYEVVRFDCYACQVNSTVNWETTPLFLEPYRNLVNRFADAHGVDPALVRAIIHAESAFNPAALSRVGAQGLMQLMPGTAGELGVTNPLDAEQNISGGVRYLAKLLKLYDGNTRLATAAYNAGPGAVGEYSGVPPYAETQAYVKRVAILHRRYQTVE